jgi:pimeloyl-ACP methyl ester carboxylesterase/membrane protein DedA with SNARE-associated domain
MKEQTSAERNSKLGGWQFFAAGYFILLLLSHFVRMIFPAEFPPEPDQKVVFLKGTDYQDGSGNPIKIAYHENYRGREPDPPVILLLHGSPVGVEMFYNFIPELTKRARVITPDLPGYNASSRNLKDFSFRAQARYLIQFMNQLSLKEVHIVGYSLGGAVGIEMSAMEPERLASLVMVAGLGVQELELLGDYHLNHTLHGAQMILIWLLHEGVPHFGVLDKFPVNIPYARNFYDSDQRHLREYLKKISMPTLIIHGENDGLVQAATAKEHYRLIPQSELILYDSGHGLVISRAERLSNDIGDFISRVEKGEAPTRASAGAQRIAEAEAPFEEVDIPHAEGITLFVFMVLIALATLVSEDLACIGAGLMAARGVIGLLPAIIATFSGIFVGDMLLYLAGKFLGRPVLKYAPFKWLLKDEDIARSSRWLAARGPAIIIASRFLPGSRLPTYFGAGVLEAGFWMFTFYFFIASALWTPLLVGLSSLAGNQLLNYYSVFQQYALLVLLAAVLLLWSLVKAAAPLFSYRGRRLLLSRYRRKVRWEFWPRRAFYPPIFFYVLYLGLRYRKLTLFTAANPAIPAGGFVGESKAQILEGLKGSREFIARYRRISHRIPREEQLKQFREFQKNPGIPYPVVLKPDMGERGEGVAIVRSEAEAERYLAAAKADTIAQEYVVGQEYGVFYYRYPDEERGHIFSITDKRLLTLRGDGKSTLEELILKDDRAVCMAPFHLKKHRERLFDVPSAGEEITLVEVGTHCRGALFLDGISLLTPAMEAAMDRISKGFEGFYFGRYDIRTPSLEDFRQGKNFKIVELNGVTSEATHIYDHRTLREQWRIAFEIGAANAQRGVEPASPGDLVRALVRWKRGKGQEGQVAG